jgi:Glu-tRNA(Gln) amidotransferase subunit E-like FAD-binding protein
MKHLRKFEELEYKDMLAAQTTARQDFEKAEEERIEQKRKETSGKYLPELQAQSDKRISSDKIELERREIVQKVIDSNPSVVATFKGGKENAIMSLVGQIMKESKGSANPSLVQKLLKELLA